MTAQLLFFVAGILLGYASLMSLRWNVSRYTQGQAASLSLGIQLLRFAALAGALAAVARLGAGPLLLAAAGLLLSRLLLVGRMSRA